VNLVTIGIRLVLHDSVALTVLNRRSEKTMTADLLEEMERWSLVALGSNWLIAI